MKNDLMQLYQEQWQQKSQWFNQQSWLSTLRQQQFDLFLTKGIPTTRDEHWKYTDLSPLTTQLFSLLPEDNLKPNKETVEHFYLSDSHYRLVFVDGFFCKEFSLIHSLPQNVILTNLATALQKQEILSSYIQNQKISTAFSHLNTACMHDGLFLYLPSSTHLKHPIHLLFITTQHSQNNMQHIRNIIITDHHTQVTLLEEHQSLHDNHYLMNVMTQINAGEESSLHYIKLQNQRAETFHISNLEITQQKNSHVIAENYSLGSKLAREDIHCFLDEEGSSLQLQGLYLPLKKQHIDIHTYVHHQGDHTTSEELFKGIVAEQSRAVFNGKIIVNKNTRKTSANLQNKNLLLTSLAEVNTKPELEIYSDDVKCTHGATVGQVDKAMLFYLRSRGISKDEAYQLLLLAFLAENLNLVNNFAINQKLRVSVTNSCEEIK